MKAWADLLTVNEPEGGKWVTLDAPADSVNVHLMPGKLIVYQDNRD
jgi:alpha-glucosidase (family GH31 glycosyl hydrolase)